MSTESKPIECWAVAHEGTLYHHATQSGADGSAKAIGYGVCRVVHLVEMTPWLLTMLAAWRAVPAERREKLQYDLHRASQIGKRIVPEQAAADRIAAALLRAAAPSGRVGGCTHEVKNCGDCPDFTACDKLAGCALWPSKED